MAQLVKFLLLLFFLSANNRHVLSQESLHDFVIENTNRIESINPDYPFINDLNSIGKAIGNARIVMLGEQDHGDAPTYLAKARIIKYLHDSLDFNVIAFESDFFALNFGWTSVRSGTMGINNYLAKNIYTIWTLCQECTPVFNYIAKEFKGNSKLIVTGFDNYFLGISSKKNLKEEIDKFLRMEDIPFVKKSTYHKSFLPLLDSILLFGRRGRISDEELILVNRMHGYSTAILTELGSKLKNRFEYIVIDNLVSECRNLMLIKKNEIKESITNRDWRMAKNLRWLLNTKYPKEKFIVWAANSHIMKGSINNAYPLTMGHFLEKDPAIKDSMYALGFTDYEGVSGRVYSKPYTVSLPMKESLEYWIHRKDYNYAFINFKNERTLTNQKFLMRGQDHFQIEAKWFSIFDGIFYIKNMYPCKAK